MHNERIGYLGCRLYRLGWQNALRCNRASMTHWLLGIFLHYRRGFTSGVNYIQQQFYFEKTLR
jgi:hypothetical protein